MLIITGNQKISIAKNRNKMRIEHIAQKVIWPIARLIKKPMLPSFYSWDDIKVVLIVSTGRTGTEFLAKLFNDIFDKVDSRHEPYPDFFDLVTKYIRSEMKFNETLSRFLWERERICAQVHRRKKEIYIESNNNLAWLIKVVQKSFKNCRIVHVIRDGRTYLRSQYSKRVWPIKKQEPKVPFMSENDGRERIKAVDFSNDPYCSQWNNMNRFEKICWYWVKKDKLIYDSIKDDKNAITVKFEDIFDGDSEYKGLWEIIDFLDLKKRLSVPKEEILKKMTRKSNATKEDLLGKWETWTPEHKEQFISIAGEHMKLYGYPMEQ